MEHGVENSNPDLKLYCDYLKDNIKSLEHRRDKFIVILAVILSCDLLSISYLSYARSYEAAKVSQRGSGDDDDDDGCLEYMDALCTAFISRAT